MPMLVSSLCEMKLCDLLDGCSIEEVEDYFSKVNTPGQYLKECTQRSVMP